MNRNKQTTPRAEFVRQRRTIRKSQIQRSDTTPRRASPETAGSNSLANIFLPVKPTADARRHQGFQTGTSRKQVQFAYTAARPRVHAPAISLPQFNMRWVSALLTAALLFAIYAVWNSPAFTIHAAEVSGNSHLSQEQIYSALNVDGDPIFKAVPARLENTLRSNLPELEYARVRVSFPNRILVDVSERIPVLDWYSFNPDGEIIDRRLIDINGVAFTPSEGAEGLIVVYATGTPPALAVPEEVTFDTPFISPEMVNALVALFPYVPADMPIAYDPEYGIGWQDGRGWRVFFGQNMQDIDVRITTYQSISAALAREGVQPELISLAYLDTPFIK